MTVQRFVLMVGAVIFAGMAAQLLIFQRTPNYAVPAHNAPLSRTAQQAVKADYAGLRARAQQARCLIR